MDAKGLDILGSSRNCTQEQEGAVCCWRLVKGQCGQDPEDSAYSEESLQQGPGEHQSYSSSKDLPVPPTYFFLSLNCDLKLGAGRSAP